MNDTSISHWIGNAKCPNITYNGTLDTCIHQHTSLIVSAGLISSNLSILGSIFIIATYIGFVELRTKARLILLMISISDLVNSVSYVFAFIYTSVKVDYSLCYANKPFMELYLCAVQSAVNLFATLASSCWTCVLGIHITCLFYRINSFDNKYVSVFFHTFSWCAPLLVASVAFLTNALGPGTQSVNVGWCFVNNYSSSDTTKEGTDQLIIEFFIGKLWEFVTVAILAIVYTVSSCKICRFNYQKEGLWMFKERHDFRLIWIPLVYLILRVWGNIRWILGIAEMSKRDTCVQWEIGLAMMEVIGDTAQGWANAILYVLFNQAMRKRILSCCWGICSRRNGETSSLLKDSDIKDIQSFDEKNISN